MTTSICRSLTLLLSLLGLLVLAPSRAHAQTDPIAQLQQQMAVLSVQLNALKTRVATLESDNIELRANVEAATLLVESAQADTDLVTLKLAHVSVSSDGRDIFVDGANLHIRNGAGGTRTSNGVGNLVLGYDEPVDSYAFYDTTGTGVEQQGGSQKTGSHNLVIGDGHSYTSFAGIVAGRNNRGTGAYATITAGEANIARGAGASVSGGSRNLAKGSLAAVSGGLDNDATGDNASVSGGAANVASGARASVLAGSGNSAEGPESAIVSGSGNRAIGPQSSVLAGSLNRSEGSQSAIVAGGFNNASGQNAAVVAGVANTASGGSSAVVAGRFNSASGLSSTVSGGSSASSAGDFSVVP
jgi:trimeric autotransporter adhesin